MWNITEIRTEQVTEEQMNQEIEMLKHYGYEETKNPFVLFIGWLISKWRA